MKKLAVVGRGIVLAMGLVATALLVPLSAYADANLPPALPNSPHLPETHRPMLLEPSPVGMGAMARSAAIPDTVISSPTMDMKVLVLLDSTTYDFGSGPFDYGGINQMITGYLDVLGIPYDVLDVGTRGPGITTPPLFTETDLWDGESHGYYYAVFVATSLVWWPSLDYAGLTLGEQEMIRSYERNFGVRRVTWSAYPEATQYGLDAAATITTAVSTTLTTDGQSVFGYLKADTVIPIAGSGTFGTSATPAVGAVVTPLLQTSSDDTILAIYEPDNAGEHMVLTISGYYPVIPPANIYTRLLPYGMINWATRGLFLGERHLYFVGQPDDVLSWGDRWDVATHTTIFDRGYRNEPQDIEDIVTWMDWLRTNVPNAADFKMEMPFNGEGSLNDRVGGDSSGDIIPGSLTAKVVELASEFVWLNHTYSHADLNPVDTALALYEIGTNTDVATALAFTDYTSTTLLTGAYSGLTNTAVINAGYDLGLRYILANESVDGYKNPTPNTGIPHPAQPEILMVPRYANNIFYYATTPEEEVDFYNWLYCDGYQANPDPANRCYDYETTVDLITNQALGFMLDFSINPTMFHMNNLENYGGGRSLVGDFVESLYAKYNTYYRDNVPILSLRTQEIGEKMWERMTYNDSGVAGVIGCGNWVTVTTTGAARIPVTGINYGGDTEEYAGQAISYLDMSAGGSISVPGSSPTTVAPVTTISIIPQGADVSISWSPTTQDAQGNPMSALVYRIYRGSDPNFAITPESMIAEVSELSYVDLGASGGGYSYAVSAVGDDCWKRESDATRPSPTAIRLTTLEARSVMSVALMPAATLGLLLLAVVWIRTKTGA